MRQIRAKYLGLFAGLFFGWIIIHYGLFKAVFVAVLGAAGWYVGRVLDGEADLSGFVRRPENEDLE
jgi:uncharacterized membrane protein